MNNRLINMIQHAVSGGLIAAGVVGMYGIEIVVVVPAIIFAIFGALCTVAAIWTVRAILGWAAD